MRVRVALDAWRGDPRDLLLFFDTPARSLGAATFELGVAGDDGGRLGTVRIPRRRDG